MYIYLRMSQLNSLILVTNIQYIKQDLLMRYEVNSICVYLFLLQNFLNNS